MPATEQLRRMLYWQQSWQVWKKEIRTVMAENIKCEILETCIEFPETRGYHLELNLVKWGDNEPKYDLRRWNEDRSKMTKGVTLSKEELLILQDELSNIKF